MLKYKEGSAIMALKGGALTPEVSKQLVLQIN